MDSPLLDEEIRRAISRDKKKAALRAEFDRRRKELQDWLNEQFRDFDIKTIRDFEAHDYATLYVSVPERSFALQPGETADLGRGVLVSYCYGPSLFVRHV